MTEAPVVRTEGLTKAYGRRADLSDLYLEIQPGEVFGYLGPNGAGKTTTLRLLAGMLRPTAGRADGRTGVRRVARFRRGPSPDGLPVR